MNQPPLAVSRWAAFLLLLATSLHAIDWPAYRGPSHDGTSPERIRKAWPAQGPRLLWRASLAGGFSSFTTSNHRAFTLVRRTVQGRDAEVCVALDLHSGTELWSQPLGPATYEAGGDNGAPGNTGGDGPRSTPVVNQGRVYTLSAYLRLACWDAATGQPLWDHDLPAEYNASPISWQNAASPVVEGDLVLVNANSPGHRLMAFAKHNGALRWQALDERLTHSTPVLATLHGVRQAVFATQSGLLAVNPLDGTLLWRSSLSFSTSTGISPVVAQDIVYLSAAYQIGAVAVQVSKSGSTFTADRLWRRSGQLMNHWSTPVHHEGHLYGLYGYAAFGSAPLKCVHLATGTETWSAPGFGQGGLLLADGVLLVLTDAGQIVQVAPNPAAYHEIARFQAVSGKCWNAPALSDGLLLVRSTLEGACYDLAPPRLQWRPPSVHHPSRLELGLDDGSPLDAERAARLELKTAADLSLPLHAWFPASLQGVLTNGLLRFETPADPTPGPRFFIALEPSPTGP